MYMPTSKTFAQASVGSRKRVAEGENASISRLFEFKAEHAVNIACVLQQTRWVELSNRRMHDNIGRVPALISVEPAQLNASPLPGFDLSLGQPCDELLRLGESCPDLFDRMMEMAHEAKN